jgi:uridylate kinase
VKLTKVDGVYDKDPLQFEGALKYDDISYDEFLQKDLKVFDQTGIILARDNHLPIFVSKLDDGKALRDIIF